MGFSIGGFLKSVVKTVAPAVGAVFGGPIGFGIGSALSGALTSSSSPAAAVAAPLGAGITTLAAASLPRIIGALPALRTTAGTSVLSTILEQAKENTGKRVSRREIITAARVCGIDVAAQTFGLTDTQICQIVAAGLPRRRRGISAADLRRTRSTIRKVDTIRRDLKKLGGR